MSIKFNILFRACDKVEFSHKSKRPFNLNKKEVIKIAFNSLFNSLENFDARFIIIGDDLSNEVVNFFKCFKNTHVFNEKLGSASASLARQIEIGLTIPQEEWIYFCEDDYLHKPECFDYISEFIENKTHYLKTSGKKKNFWNRLVGDLSKADLIIHPPDYPDRYLPYWKRPSYVFISKYCHWRQITNTTHTFLMHSETLHKFKDSIIASSHGPSDSVLSQKVYGKFFFQRKAICISPIPGLSCHLHESVLTPIIDWKELADENIKLMKNNSIWNDQPFSEI